MVHKPYIAAHATISEFSLKALFLGLFFGLIFGASTSYLALKVGLTVSASIPIAVLSIAIFKRWGGATILENNIVQTVGSAGESIAAGVAFTVPALLFLSAGKEYFTYFSIFFLALVGGLLGTLFMIPLRKNLIVEEHGNLLYPEGVACADILIAGEKGGSLARQVYFGIGIAVLYKFLMSILGLWKEIPQYLFSKKSALPNALLAAEVTPELLGVGYIIGVRASAIMVGGGILSSLVFIPLFSYLGSFTNEVIAPGKILITDMSSMDIWSNYIRYIGAGAVTLGGIMTLGKTIPTIIKTIKSTWKQSYVPSQKKEKVTRTDYDLPIPYIVIGIVLLIIGIIVTPHLPITALSAFLIAIAAFFFVIVSSRIVGLIGLSSNPISGMTIATLMGVSLVFIIAGMTGELYQPIALCVGAIVAIAAANAGATSQDLKTGFLVGATPIKQQIGIMCGVLVAAITVGFTVSLLYRYVGIGEVTVATPHPLPAPQATLMATLIKGLFDQNLPWTLVLVGMAIALVVELCGINALAFAVGIYLPLATTSPIFIGGLVKGYVTRKRKLSEGTNELEQGALFSSGLIAGGALMGILLAFLLGAILPRTSQPLIELFHFHLGEGLSPINDLIALIAFAILTALLLFFSLKKR